MENLQTVITDNMVIKSWESRYCYINEYFANFLSDYLHFLKINSRYIWFKRAVES